ncbi:MAG: S1 RNA-binding domain-containing protein [Clostridia bacterium]|nr:S1 RNA-binding domain-containing protein [Clostridia bacterium]
MKNIYKPEGMLWSDPRNRELLSSRQGLERAMYEGTILEAPALLCDSSMRLHVDLGCMPGIIEPEDTVFCRPGEVRKPIAVITRVGKPVAFRVMGFGERNGKPCALLSRRLAQEECIRSYLSDLIPGDIIPARVTHMESFGAFVDIGCGISSLLSVDCISVSRISHPKDRLQVGQTVFTVVKAVDEEHQRLFVSMRELLGTWEENAAHFSQGQTVAGIVRSVESYGAFVELAPNLAGLAEIREGTADESIAKVGSAVSVYIKSILPDRMKIKLVLIDACRNQLAPAPLTYYVDGNTVSHLPYWRYSPPSASKIIESIFE